MAKVTNYECLDEAGRSVRCDAFGNNVAFSCPECSHPVLATMLKNQRGSDLEHPVACRECEARYWIESQAENEVLLINGLDKRRAV